VTITNLTTYGGVTNYFKTVPVTEAISLEAPASSDEYTFNNWSGCTSATDMTCYIDMNSDMTVTATYTPSIEVLEVKSSGASGVDIGSTTGDGGTTTYIKEHANGYNAVLVAPVTWGSGAFSSWTGCTTTIANTCNVTVSGATSVTANYVPASNEIFTNGFENPL